MASKNYISTYSKVRGKPLKVFQISFICMSGHVVRLHVWCLVHDREAVRDQVGAIGVHDVRQRVQSDLDDIFLTGFR